MDIDRTAPVIVELTTTISAPLATVWQTQTAIDEWPTWQKDVSRAALRGPLAVGESFDWETAGLAVTSTIRAIEPMHRIAWGGPARGIDGKHVWIFEDTPDGVVVHTAESWSGAPVDADPQGLHAALEGSLTNWLAELKATAEAAG
jgi:uncharacterized protein YndB with AHSA1/START domain